MKPWWHGEQDPDAATIMEAKRGSQRAFDLLRAKHERPLRGFVARRVGADAADDLTQEIWLACWQALPKYAGRSRFKAWLYGIATHKCSDCVRAQIQQNRRNEEACREEGRAPDAYQTVDLRDSVRQALGRIPDTQREVLELYYYAELTLAEIAQELNRNLNTVKYQFYRAHDLVAQELRSEDTGAQ